MESAFRLAAIVVQRLLVRDGSLSLLRTARLNNVVVLSGSYDKVERILELLSVRYRLDPEHDDLGEAKVIFANSSEKRRPGFERSLKWFCFRGGWLVSTDWCLQSLIEETFPGTVRRKPEAVTRDECIRAEAAADGPFADVDVPGRPARWRLSCTTYPIEVLDERNVRIDAASHDLLVRYGAPALAVNFSWGRGRVRHVAGHLWNPDDSFQPPEQGEHDGFRDSSSVEGTCEDFLRDGVRLDDAERREAFREASVSAEEVSYDDIQSAVVVTLLVARSICSALRENPSPAPKPGPLQRLLNLVRRSGSWENDTTY